MLSVSKLKIVIMSIIMLTVLKSNHRPSGKYAFTDDVFHGEEPCLMGYRKVLAVIALCLPLSALGK